MSSTSTLCVPYGSVVLERAIDGECYSVKVPVIVEEVPESMNEIEALKAVAASSSSLDCSSGITQVHD